LIFNLDPTVKKMVPIHPGNGKMRKGWEREENKCGHFFGILLCLADFCIKLPTVSILITYWIMYVYLLWTYYRGYTLYT